MDPQTFSALLDKYLSEELSREEVNQLLDSLEDEQFRGQWNDALDKLLANRALHGLSDRDRMDVIRQRIVQRPPYRRLRTFAAAAAVLALAVSGLLYFIRETPPTTRGTSTFAADHQVKPGGNKAVLTLADGSEITLDSAGNGAIAQQGNVQVIKLNSGQLAYQAGGGAQPKSGYNTLTTPRGGQFRIVLPDGSNVWLNAASSLRFPTAFAGNERAVELQGEAYFEIAHNTRQPFKVMVNDMTVQVLGTHFNVMAYADEQQARTTLLQGAVKVVRGAQALTLKPGQQAVTDHQSNINLKENINLEEVVAWKNGYFQFNHEPLEGVMRQVGRWYDAEIAYEGNVPSREFGGQVLRSSSITDVLKMLELTGVHFRLEGKKIIVTP